MLELLVVIVIVGILASIAMPRFGGSSAFDERGFLDQSRSTLRYAQKLAIAARREVCVTFTASTIALTLNPNPVPPSAPCTQVVNMPGEATTAYIITAPATGPVIAPVPPPFRFNGRGQPTNAAGNLLPSQVVNIVGSANRAINITTNTGYVN